MDQDPASAISSPRGHPWLAWLVILCVVAFILLRQSTGKEKEGLAEWLVPLQTQSRYFVAMGDLKFLGNDKKEIHAQVQKLVDKSNYSQRLRLAILSGELEGSETASDSLKNLEKERESGELEASEASQNAVKLLERLYRGYQEEPGKISLGEDEQKELREGLGWFGDLALGSKDGLETLRSRAMVPARRTLVAFVLLALFVVLGLLLGLFLMILSAIFFFQGRMRSGFVVGPTSGGIYAETFAAYMVLFIAIGWLFHFLPESWSGLWNSGVAMILSLGALAWPVFRGIPWSQVKKDLGLMAPKSSTAELFAGIGGYATAIPILAMGLLVMFVLMALGKHLSGGEAPPSPSHPIIGVALKSGWWIWVQVFVVACVLAPIVEEIMFRGALYRHLRGWAGVLGAVVLSSLLFAVIHPQGWYAVPVLSGLALVFSLLREWRGTVFAPMVTHAINNSVSMTLLMILST